MAITGSSARQVTTMNFSAFRFSVWPFYALGLFTLILGSVFIFIWWPGQYPDESGLVRLSGKIAKIEVRDDLSDSTAGAMLQGWTSTYFILEGIDGEFRYPRTHPKNLLVRDQTSVALDVWVERAAIGRNKPMIIWQLREHNPYKKEHSDVLTEETFVTHAEIVERLKQIDRSMVKTGIGFLVFGFASVLLGTAARWWNINRAPPEH